MTKLNSVTPVIAFGEEWLPAKPAAKCAVEPAAKNAEGAAGAEMANQRIIKASGAVAMFTGAKHSAGVTDLLQQNGGAREKPPWVINPNSKNAKRWDLLMVLLLLFTATVITFAAES